MMDGKPRKNAYTPQRSSDHKTEEDEKSKDGTTQAFSMVRTMKKLMKSKKKSSKSNSTTTTGSSSSRHHLVSEHTQARRQSKERSAEKVDEKELCAKPTLVAHTGPDPSPSPFAKQKIPQAGETLMVFTVFENDKMEKGNHMAVCRTDKEPKLQWLSAEAERAAKEEDKEVKIPDEPMKTPVKKEKSKQRGKTIDSPGPAQCTTKKKNGMARTPMNKVSPGGPPRTPGAGRTPAKTPAKTPVRTPI